MAFRYIQLTRMTNGRIVATVLNHGSVSSVGSAHTRMTHGPFAVFQVDEFWGLEHVTDDELWKLMQDRDMVTDVLEQKFIQGADIEILLAELHRRLDK